jgi:hypothetical protein
MKAETPRFSLADAIFTASTGKRGDSINREPLPTIETNPTNN